MCSTFISILDAFFRPPSFLPRAGIFQGPCHFARSLWTFRNHSPDHRTKRSGAEDGRKCTPPNLLLTTLLQLAAWFRGRILTQSGLLSSDLPQGGGWGWGGRWAAKHEVISYISALGLPLGQPPIMLDSVKREGKRKQDQYSWRKGLLCQKIGLFSPASCVMEDVANPILPGSLTNKTWRPVAPS